MLYYQTIDSTQFEARRLIDDGSIANREFILASEQTHGIGRKCNRTWESKNGNIYASFVINVCDTNLTITHIPFLACIAVGQTIDNIFNKQQLFEYRYKWPNDILINDKKTCGILCEFYKNFIIIGIGLNINKFPQDINATSILHELSLTNTKQDTLDQNTNAVDLCKTCAQDIQENINTKFTTLLTYGFASIRNEWLQKAWRLNSKVIIQEQEVIFKSIDEDGAILTRDVNNQIKRFTFLD